MLPMYIIKMELSNLYGRRLRNMCVWFHLYMHRFQNHMYERFHYISMPSNKMSKQNNIDIYKYNYRRKIVSLGNEYVFPVYQALSFLHDKCKINN